MKKYQITIRGLAPAWLIIFLLPFMPAFSYDGILPASDAMGGADTAISGGYEAIFINPAGLAHSKTNKITVSQARLYFDTYAYETGFCAGFPESAGDDAGIKGGYAAGFGQQVSRNTAMIRTVFNPDGTPKIDPVSGLIETETAGFADKVYSRLNIGAAMTLGSVSLGISAAGMEIQHGGLSAWGFGINCGAMYKPAGEMRLGIAVANAGRTAYFWPDNRGEYEPMQADAGAAYELFDRVLLAVDAGYLFDGAGSFVWGAGAEVKIFEMLKLRAGFRDSKTRFGFVFTADKLSIDYGFIVSSNFYEAGRLGATLEF